MSISDLLDKHKQHAKKRAKYAKFTFPAMIRNSGWTRCMPVVPATLPLVAAYVVWGLIEAIQLYRDCGYQEVEAFNDEPYAHYWFEKRL
jgi:hypothetical protein